MTRTTLSLFCSVVISLMLVACSQTANKPADAPAASATATPAASSAATPAVETSATAPEDVVQASAPEVEIKAGGAAEATVRVKIADGYHINGNPASKFQIATTLEVESGDGLTAAQPVYPPSVKKTFEFSKEPIVIYEGEAVIKQPLRAGPDAAKGSHSLRAKLRVQPCDNKVCFPPRTLDVSLPVSVK
jgi:DsbC/DsbD-like thiol-disulfide interchange protein